jgi:GT2 family glycosyltransferase
MAVYDTEDNQRSQFTNRTLRSLYERVDFKKHRLIISDNGSCEETQRIYKNWLQAFDFKIIENGENLGTARAINRAWSFRKAGEHAVKMDNDVVVHYDNWVDDMELAFEVEPDIGICGLKRKDLIESPDHPDPNWRSQLVMLKHEPGHRWIVVENVNHVMGTCQAFSSALLDKIGYMYQGDWKYGFDDTLASVRAHMAGKCTVFLPYIEIDHIDCGGTLYTEEKSVEAGVVMPKYQKIVDDYNSGKQSVYFDGGEDALWAKRGN